MSEKYIAPNTNTAEWASIPFEVKGVQFVSKIKKNTPLGKRCLSISTSLFAKMNEQAILEMMGNPSLMTRQEIVDSLAHANYNGTQAILELA